jgi:integrase
MPRILKPLTSQGVDKAHRTRAPAILRDGAAPGLYLSVGPLGSVWGAQLRGTTGRKRVALGSYPRMGLGEARDAARAARERLRTGEGETLGELVDAYGDHEEHRLKKWRHMRGTIKHVFKAHLDTPCQHLTIPLLQKTIDAHRARSTAHHAGRYLRPILKWGRVREITDLDGSLFQLPKGTNKRRQRVLSEDELRAVLRALRERRHPADDIAMLILLTACRREELAALRWEEVGTDTMTIPPERHKSQEGLTIPLSPQARALLPPRGTGRVWPLQINWFHWQAKMFERTGTTGWQRHDLRRTAATTLGRKLSVPPHVIEAVLGHTHVGGTALASIYNMSRYLPEHTEALQKLANYYSTLT